MPVSRLRDITEGLKGQDGAQVPIDGSRAYNLALEAFNVPLRLTRGLKRSRANGTKIELHELAKRWEEHLD